VQFLPEERRSGIERASRRKVRLILIAAIAVVIAGLVALGAIVVGTLGTQLTELSRIGDDHARAVGTTMHLRDHLASLGRQLSEALARPRGAIDVAGELRALDAAVEQLELLCAADEERAAVKRVREALRRVSTLASRVERERAAGQLMKARTSARELSDVTAEVNRGTDQLVGFNAGEVRDAAAAVHTSVVRSLVASSALAFLVMAGALVLLRQALRAVEVHEDLVQRHADDLAAFASRAAHELRTPLHTISLSLHVLRKVAGQESALERAEASARRLAETIDDILRFSRSGGAPEPGASCRVGAVVDAVAAELGPRAADAGLELVTEASGPLEVAMTEGHLRTVLQNLVGNSIKYGQSERGRVTVRAAPQGGWAAISVADTGPGIPRDALEHVFEPFYRASTAAEGYGLGLPTVKRLVEAHGGSVRLTSAPGAGTTVTVALPRPPRQRETPTALPS
jgi:signal transduction histidine kinase